MNIFLDEYMMYTVVYSIHDIYSCIVSKKDLD